MTTITTRPSWKVLPQWARDHQHKLDRHLLLALATDFADHVRGPRARKPNLQNTPFDVMLKLASPESHAAIRKMFQASGTARLSSAHLDAGSQYACATVDLKMLAQLASSHHVAAIEWGQALLAERTLDRRATASAVKAAPSALPNCTGEVLLGVIDHGFPFAHSAFRTGTGSVAGGNGTPGTRVLSIWDQDAKPDFDPNLGAPAGFGYGRQATRAVLNRCIADATRQGLVNEARCYDLARYSALKDSVTHGSHTAGLFAGAWRSPSVKPLDPPRGAADTDVAATSDLVFVQLPRGILQAPSHGGDHRCVLDGVRYIVACASKTVKTIVVVIDYGSYLGSHDGSSFMEGALDAMVAEQKQLGRQLKLVFPTGNGQSDQSHAHANLHEGPSCIAWRVPPGSETAGFAEIWLPAAQSGLALSITLPIERGGSKTIHLDRPGVVGWPEGELAQAGFNAIRMDLGDSGTVILMRAAPTRADHPATALAASGRYEINLPLATGDAKKPLVACFYSCWGGENMGFPRRSYQARWLKISSNVTVDGLGSILGTACANGVTAVAGLVYSAGRLFKIAPYAGLGPTRATAQKPIHAAMSDDSPLQTGVLGLGTRSGSTTRMWGTSVAAPIAARVLAKRPQAGGGSSKPGKPLKIGAYTVVE